MRGVGLTGRDRDGGFSFIEVMLSMAVVAVALTAMLGAQSQGVSAAAEARFWTTAPLLANAVLARYETAGPPGLADDSGDFGDAFPGYRWLAEVGEPVLDEWPDLSERLRLVDVVVTAGGFGSLSYRIRRCLYLPE